MRYSGIDLKNRLDLVKFQGCPENKLLLKYDWVKSQIYFKIYERGKINVMSKRDLMCNSEYLLKNNIDAVKAANLFTRNSELMLVSERIESALFKNNEFLIELEMNYLERLMSNYLRVGGVLSECLNQGKRFGFLACHKWFDKVNDPEYYRDLKTHRDYHLNLAEKHDLYLFDFDEFVNTMSLP